MDDQAQAKTNAILGMVVSPLSPEAEAAQRMREDTFLAAERARTSAGQRAAALQLAVQTHGSTADETSVVRAATAYHKFLIGEEKAETRQ